MNYTKVSRQREIPTHLAQDLTRFVVVAKRLDSNEPRGVMYHHSKGEGEEIDEIERRRVCTSKRISD